MLTLTVDKKMTESHCLKPVYFLFTYLTVKIMNVYNTEILDPTVAETMFEEGYRGVTI